MDKITTCILDVSGEMHKRIKNMSKFSLRLDNVQLMRYIKK